MLILFNNYVFWWNGLIIIHGCFVSYFFKFMLKFNVLHSHFRIYQPHHRWAMPPFKLFTRLNIQFETWLFHIGLLWHLFLIFNWNKIFFKFIWVSFCCNFWVGKRVLNFNLMGFNSFWCLLWDKDVVESYEIEVAGSCKINLCFNLFTI